jgi:hypothetical protein
MDSAEIVEAFRRFAAANPTTRGERQPSCLRATRRRRIAANIAKLPELVGRRA